MTKADPPPAYKFKIVLLGSFGVGKTSLTRRFIEDTFSEEYKSTLGVDIKYRVMTIDGTTVSLTVWDPEGINEHNPYPKDVYIKGAHGFLVVSDGTREKTLDLSLELNKDLQERNRVKRDIQEKFATIPFFVVVNKCDLIEQWKFADEEIEQLQNTFLKQEGVKDISERRLLKTSAKSGQNVEDAFRELVRQILKNYERYRKP
ncbi:MAG: hypothetical protein NPIRA05_15820 [Nitrospirales bacterium]|nr:MAG: hypothetical protein NPIRA05_15820 [Nitrospirales bacterium]